MTFLKRGIVYFLVGVGFGGLLYLFFLWQNNVTTQTTHQITSVVLVSGLIGIVSMIFEVGVIPITWEILIHFCLVYGLNSWLNMLIGTTTSFIWSLPFLGEFFLTYLIIWLVIYISFNHRIKNINQKLQEKTKK